MMENLRCQLEKILQLVKNQKRFSINIGKKEVALANETVTLTEGERLDFFGYRYDNIQT